jgi:hypothetical protein
VKTPVTGKRVRGRLTVVHVYIINICLPKKLKIKIENQKFKKKKNYFQRELKDGQGLFL